MLPLHTADVGEEVIVKKVTGTEEEKKSFAEDGFVPGATVRIVSAQPTRLIVSVGDTRFALSHESADRIFY